MWIIRIKIKHECVIGSRCEKFKVSTIGTPFNVYTEKGVTYAPQIHTIIGDEINVKSFIKDIKKDKKIKNL